MSSGAQSGAQFTVVKRHKAHFQESRKVALTCGAPEEIRTPNLLIRSQMLYPLSYGRYVFSCMAEARGFEPPVRFEADNSLAVSPIRPLWHASLNPKAQSTQRPQGTAKVIDPARADTVPLRNVIM